MQTAATKECRAAGTDVYVALELGGSKWVLCFGNGEKRRNVTIDAGDYPRLMAEITAAKERLSSPEARMHSCYEAGRDGFAVHRWLTANGVESLVVDSSSIKVDRRKLQAKTDRLDAGRLVQLLQQHVGGVSDVWHVLRVPTEAQEDERQGPRELSSLKMDRTAARNRMTSLLFAQGIRLKPASGVPTATEFDADLTRHRTPHGKPLGPALHAELMRSRERLELLDTQIHRLETQRSHRLAVDEKLKHPANQQGTSDPVASKVRTLMLLSAIGANSAWLFVTEFFGWRKFANRREVAGAAGLVPVPFASGDVDRSQGISKAGNSRVRDMIVEIAWGWLRFQPDSELSRWFQKRYANASSRQRRVGIVALARKLLIALWRFVELGVVPAGARFKPT